MKTFYYKWRKFWGLLTDLEKFCEANNTRPLDAAANASSPPAVHDRGVAHGCQVPHHKQTWAYFDTEGRALGVWQYSSGTQGRTWTKLP